MKEVYDISLSGISFKIEKDAYDLLDNYLVELKGHYGEQEAEDEAEGTGRHRLASQGPGGGSPCQKERKMTDLTMKNLRTGL